METSNGHIIWEYLYNLATSAHTKEELSEILWQLGIGGASEPAFAEASGDRRVTPFVAKEGGALLVSLAPVSLVEVVKPNMYVA